jgi:hypothetical protein
MRKTLALLAIACSLTFACRKDATNVAGSAPGGMTASASKSPEELGAIGAEIKKRPSDAKQILSQHGLSEDAFETQIRRTTEDPDASKRYAAAYRKAL